MKTKILVAIAVVVAIAAMVTLYAQHAKSFGAGSLNGAFYTASNTTVAMTNSPAVVLAANSGRLYAAISNDGANVVYLNFNGSATAGKGVRLAAGAVYEIYQTKLYLGSVYGVTASGTSTLSIIEK